jgi:Dolichyl-phosphate-mannose-protein mannosyltransferase
VNCHRSVGSSIAISVAEGLAPFAISLALIVTLQILAGAYANGFGAHPDEAAHTVTSLMVRDFIAGLDFRHPWQFAQQYYYHYPKVMIGIWPPAFYGLLGAWFLIAGASRTTAVLFIAVVAATTAGIIYLTGKRLIGRWAGALAAFLFVASPLVQESSASVMTEHLVTLAMLVATLCFARFVRTERIRDGLAFGIVAAAAILTHGNAWALGLVPGITLALTNRWYLLRRLGLWLAAVPVLFSCVPWYVFTLGLVKGSLPGVSDRIAAVPGFTRAIYLSVGLPVLIFALIGVWGTIIRIKPRAEMATEWAALAGLAVATFILYCVLPVDAESRYMVTLVPSIALFSACGVNEIAHRLSARLPLGVVNIGLVLILIAAFSATSFSLPQQLRNGGYDSLVRDGMALVSNRPQIWLISSDSIGEGSLVAAVALSERRPGSYVLRARTILGGGDMYWRNMQDRFDTPAKLAALLDELPVTMIVLDDNIPLNWHRPYQDRLGQLVADDKEWKLIGSYAQIRDGIRFPNSLHLYARRPVLSPSTPVPMIDLDRLKALMVRDELR